MATCWAKCSDLFLYTKGNDVYLWRWNKTTWMPMKTADFEDLGKVTDYVDLIGGKDSTLDWDKSSYNGLVAYISLRRLLVNSKGLVIAELGFYGQAGKMEKNEQPFYIRLLDVLSLKPFGLRDRTIPWRTVRYLETKGRVAPVEGSTITITSSSSTESDDDEKRAGVEKQVVAELKTANKTLKSDKEVADKQVTELKETNKTFKSEKEVGVKQETELKDRNKDLVEDVAAQKTVAANEQQERDEAKRDKEAAEKQVMELEETKKTLKRDKKAAEKKAVDLQTQINNVAQPINNEKKEVWMNNFRDEMGCWKLATSLKSMDTYFHVSDVKGQGGGLYTKDDELTTNVRASYMCNLSLRGMHNELISGPNGSFRAVRLNDLNPNKEKAKFTRDWLGITYKGDLYVTKVSRVNG